MNTKVSPPPCDIKEFTSEDVNQNLIRVMMESNRQHEATRELLGEIKSEVSLLKLATEFNAKTLKEHTDQEEEKLKSIRNSVNRVENKILEGFPNRDPVDHRRRHDDQISEEEIKKKRKDEVITHMIKNIAWAALVVIGGALWMYFKYQVKA